MTDEQRLSNMEARIARLEERDINRVDRVNGMVRTLYGMEGNGGLQRDVLLTMDVQKKHVDATGQVVAAIQATLLGERGDNGLVGDVGRLTRILTNVLWWLKYVVTPLLVVVLTGLLAKSQLAPASVGP